MSTIGYKDWAVDLADVGAVYPFQGWEITMTVIGVVFWLGWHILQMRRENAEIEEARKEASAADIKKAVERY